MHALETHTIPINLICRSHHNVLASQHNIYYMQIMVYKTRGSLRSSRQRVVCQGMATSAVQAVKNCLRATLNCWIRWPRACQHKIEAGCEDDDKDRIQSG